MMKKLLSLALALVMILSLSVTAFADESDSVTNLYMAGNTVATRSYKGYQLMTATNADSSKYAYTVNEKYAPIMREVLGLAVDADPDLIVAAVATKDAAGIRDFADDVYAAIIVAGSAIEADATWTGAETTVDQGYWLIADVTTNENLGDYQTRSLVMIDTVGDAKVTVTTKDKPVEDHKKTDDENDSLIYPDGESEDSTEINQDIADYDLGDSVPYSLFTKLPANVTSYKYFVWMIKDTASEGLTFQEGTFEIVINATTKYTQTAGEIAKVDSANAKTAKFLYTITENADKSNTLMVFPNFGYTRLDAEAVAGEDGVLTKPVTGPDNVNGGDIMQVIPEATINEATVEFNYECVLNSNAVIGGDGNKNTFNFIYSNDPHHDSFGETPDDINIILTWKVIVNKIDGSTSEALEGADFELYKFIGILPTGTAEADVAEYEANNNVDLEFLNTANTWGVWKKVASKSTNAVADNAETEEDETAGATTFNFSHIDDGFYKLVETVVPEGYNAIDPMIFSVKANHLTALGASAEIWQTTADGDEIVVNGDLSATTSEKNGTITMNVVNNAGAELPSTGGMGTTMLYVVGGLMVMFAVVMLVTKKRMGNEA